MNTSIKVHCNPSAINTYKNTGLKVEQNQHLQKNRGGTPLHDTLEDFDDSAGHHDPRRDPQKLLHHGISSSLKPPATGALPKLTIRSAWRKLTVGFWRAAFSVCTYVLVLQEGDLQK